MKEPRSTLDMWRGLLKEEIKTRRVMLAIWLLMLGSAAMASWFGEWGAAFTSWALALLLFHAWYTAARDIERTKIQIAIQKNLDTFQAPKVV